MPDIRMHAEQSSLFKRNSGDDVKPRPSAHETPTHFLPPGAGLKLPSYDGKEIQEVQASFAALEKEAAKAGEEALVRIAELEAELEAVKADKDKLSTVTMDEIFEKEPELKTEIDEEIKKDEWF